MTNGLLRKKIKNKILLRIERRRKEWIRKSRLLKLREKEKKSGRERERERECVGVCERRVK